MQLDPDSHQMTALVLAGDRTKADSLISHSEAGCKALIDIDGVPMVRRVLQSLREQNHLRLIGASIMFLSSKFVVRIVTILKTYKQRNFASAEMYMYMYVPVCDLNLVLNACRKRAHRR